MAFRFPPWSPEPPAEAFGARGGPRTCFPKGAAHQTGPCGVTKRAVAVGWAEGGGGGDGRVARADSGVLACCERPSGKRGCSQVAHPSRWTMLQVVKSQQYNHVCRPGKMPTMCSPAMKANRRVMHTEASSRSYQYNPCVHARVCVRVCVYVCARVYARGRACMCVCARAWAWCPSGSCRASGPRGSPPEIAHVPIGPRGHPEDSAPHLRPRLRAAPRSRFPDCQREGDLAG